MYSHAFLCMQVSKSYASVGGFTSFGNDSCTYAVSIITGYSYHGYLISNKLVWVKNGNKQNGSYVLFFLILILFLFPIFGSICVGQE